MLVNLTPEQAKKIVTALSHDRIKKRGGMAAAFSGQIISQIPQEIDHWTSLGVGMTIDSESALYQVLVNRGILTR